MQISHSKKRVSQDEEKLREQDVEKKNKKKQHGKENSRSEESKGGLTKVVHENNGMKAEYYE